MKFSLPTLIKKNQFSRDILGSKSFKEFIFSKYFLGFQVLTTFILVGWILTFIFEKHEDLVLASSLIEQLELKARKGKLNKQKEVDFFQKLSVDENPTIDQPKLEHEKFALKTFELDKSLKDSVVLANRIRTLNHNQIVFESVKEQVTKGLKETTLKLKNPIYMDEKDLNTMLKQTELDQIGGPQRVFKEFSLKLEQVSSKYQSYKVDFTLIQRKKA